LRLFVGRVGICGGKGRWQFTEALLQVTVERGSLYVGASVNARASSAFEPKRSGTSFWCPEVNAS
jgi:hypothetical protein